MSEIMEEKELPRIETRGRKPKPQVVFDPSTVVIKKGGDLKFSSRLFIPYKTHTLVDSILSTEGGVMPGTNMMIAGGPGSGKTTVCLEICQRLTFQNYKTLFISGEMDEIGYYKYCKRIPAFDKIETLFLRNYMDNAKDVLEYIFDQSYELIVLDSVAEILDMVKTQAKMTENQAERWLISLQDKHKKGLNQRKLYTSFINVQQVTKSNDVSGTNRLKHMMDAFALIKFDKSKTKRSLGFYKNRDCKDLSRINFDIGNEGVTFYFEKQ